MTRKTQRLGRISFIAALWLAPPGLPLEKVQITDTYQLIGQRGLRQRS